MYDDAGHRAGEAAVEIQEAQKKKILCGGGGKLVRVKYAHEGHGSRAHATAGAPWRAYAC